MKSYEGSKDPMAHFHLAIFTPATRQQTLERLAAAASLGKARECRDATGKPYLEIDGGAQAGLAITHMRKATPPFSIMAVGASPLFSIDAELGATAEDATFLASISAPEDAALIARIRATGLAADTVLWAAKEASLKAAGEVMHDPRNLAVTELQCGNFYTTPSAKAMAPVANTAVRFWRFRKTGNPASGILAVAVVLPHGARPNQRQDWALACDGIEIEPLF